VSSFGELQETERDREILREIGMPRKKEYCRVVLQRFL
jgi:hypothetical protein